MGLWILESRSMEHVPGTTKYFDDENGPAVGGHESAGVKYDSSGPVPIILVPQPSDDPNDPLNWPLWKRDLILFILSIVSVFATCLGSILAANTLTLSLFFSLKFTYIAELTGYFLLGVGIAGILFVPSARIWGKRHLFLLGTLLVVVTSAWGGASRSYSSLLWARIFQGIGTAPFEALVNASVGDMYFVHQRGKRMALTNLAVFGGAFFTPILVGKITHTIGWWWSFYFVAIFTGVCLPLVFSLVPETAYRRDARLNTDMSYTERSIHGSKAAAGEKDSAHVTLPSSSDGILRTDLGMHTATTDSPGPANGHTPLASRSERLRLFNGRKTDDKFFKLLLRPFPLFAHPAILWGCLIQGTMIGWTVFIGIILAAIFLGPPLFWDEVNTGYAYTGAFLGAIIGFLIAGLLADWSAKYMTRKNNGIYEPEFRIILVIPQFVFGCAGLYLFGITSAYLSDYSWVIPVFAFGLEVGGMVIGAVASSLYIVDAHRDIAIEAFTCMLIFKNFFCFGLTFSAYDWLVQGGIYKTFMWISSIQILICFLSIPMYVFGKRSRSYFRRHDILKLTGLQ